jgi:hypothetical protein
MMAPWSRAEWEAGTLCEDAFSLIVKMSAILGLTDFSGDPYVLEHWRHADAGGDWTQDGAEHLLAWMQMDVRTAGPPGLPPQERRRLLPVQSSLEVVRVALERVGGVALTEVDAIVPLHLMANPAIRLATGRDWLLLGSKAAERQAVLIEVEAGEAHGASRNQPGIIECMQTLGGEVLGAIEVRSSELRQESDILGKEGFLNRSFSYRSMQLECSTPRWAVDFAAWAIDLVAHAYRSSGMDHSALIAVRRADL